jgi:nucleotide-binding universal stress UspA family protein
VGAFRFAIHFMSAADAEVRLLHSIEMPPELRERQIAAAFDVEAVRAAAEAAARQRLEALWPGDDASAIRIVSEVAEGPARTRILEAARREDADLIVLGTHGRSAVDRLMFGSNTDAVIREAPCPVLTVRPE